MPKVVFAHELPDCECCGEPWCPVHAEHYADYPCVGPHSEPPDVKESFSDGRRRRGPKSYPHSRDGRQILTVP